MIYIVGYLPRTGSTLLMKALRGGGMMLNCHAGRDHFVKQFEDEHYRVQRDGASVLEFDHARWDDLRDGQAHKVFLPALNSLPVRCEGYRIVIPTRMPDEVAESYRRLVDVPEGSMSGEVLASHQAGKQRECENIRRAMIHLVPDVVGRMRNRRDVESVVLMPLARLSRCPTAELSRLKEHHWPIDVDAASEIVGETSEVILATT